MSKYATVFMFSGQGSQYYQMGLQLFEQNPIFRKCMLAMDEQVRDRAAWSVIETLYDPQRTKSEALNCLKPSHPAIFMVEYALAQALISGGVEPDRCLGTSLGSYAAAVIAGSIKMEDALGVLVDQVGLLETHCEEGGMIAILADPEIYQQEMLRQNSVIASHNFAKHFVLAARESKLDEIEAFLREKNRIFQRLPVPYAFHSPWIDAAKNAILQNLQSLTVTEARMPIACCVDAQTTRHLPQAYFWRTLREPIRFQETLVHMEETGPWRYIDVGPAGTLATFLKYSLAPSSGSKATAILSPYGRELQNFTAALAQ